MLRFFATWRTNKVQLQCDQTSTMQKKLGAFSELTNPTELQNSVMNLGTLVPNLLGDPVNELGQYVNNLKWLE